MPEKIETTHVLMDKTLIVYRRERSTIWQCRFKVDGVWQRASTKEHDLEKAKVIADGLRIEAEIRKRSSLPVITRKFTSVAKLAIDRMNDETAAKKGKVSYKDYIRVINEYLIPFLGKRNITSIDYAALDELDTWRITKMGKAPSQSTLLTQNAALNRVFDEAVIRGFLTDANRPKLESKGRASKRRPAFSMEEIRALFAAFDGWIDRVRSDRKEARQLMRDYVIALLETGARPGKELMNLKWKQITESIDPITAVTGDVDEYGDAIESTDLRRSVEMTVSGKTGTRNIVGMGRTVEALRAIAKRNYDVEMPLLNPLQNITKSKNNDYVFRTRDKADLSPSFQKMFDHFLEEHNLLIDPITEQKRVFYSLRHTYATFQLTYDKTPIHTLAEHMGTSTGMIEKHYSHLKIAQAIEQLRGAETQRLIESGGVIDEIYKSNKTA